MAKSKDFNMIRMWYELGIWDDDDLAFAVETSAITPEEFASISGKKYIKG